MSVETGTYLITSVHAESGHLDFPNIHIPVEPRVLPIVGSLRKDLKEQWKVTAIGGGKYTIHSTTYPKAKWVLKEVSNLNKVFIAASESEKDKATEFSIESAGDEQYRIHVPNKDQVATLRAAGWEDQLHVEKDNGADYQRWKFVKA